LNRSSWHPLPASDLPDGLILFDGVCVLCSGWVKFVLERDRKERFRFVPIQSAYGQVLAERFGIDLSAPQTNVVVDRGTAWFKLDAALVVVSHWPRWRWVAALKLVPRPVRNWLYDRVARNRYRLFGRTTQCMIPAPDIARRFVTAGPG
jgi:predicted DCC family thiol-disulfide oxidoreductase YuxK